MRTSPRHSFVCKAYRLLFTKIGVLFLNIHYGLTEDFATYCIIGKF